MVEIVPIFQNQYTLPMIIFLAIIADYIASKINEHQTSKRFLTSFVFLIGVALLQSGLFVGLKQNNIFEELKFSRLTPYQGNNLGLNQARLMNDTKKEHHIREYQMIVKSPERFMFYEKHHEITPDLHTLRNPAFQNEHIIKALNFYLVTLMIAITLTNDKKAQHARNYIISLIFALYVLEAHLILSEDAKIMKWENIYFQRVTQKELILFVKTLLLVLIIIIKHTIIHLINPMHEKTEKDYQNYLKKQDDTNTQDDSGVQKELTKIRDLVELINNGSEESTDGFSSNKTLYQVLSIMTIFMLLTGNYEE